MMIVPQTAVMAEEESGGKLVGVAMPTKDLQRWNQDGDNMKKSLEDAGYEVDPSVCVQRRWYSGISG